MTEEQILKLATVRKDELIERLQKVTNTRKEAIHAAKRCQVEILNLKPLSNADMDDWYKQQIIEITALGLLKLEE